VLGYASTILCYIAMGNAWRMGVNRAEKTQLVTAGPYRFVRHPIYLFQGVMVAAIVVLLPSAISLFVLVVHILCVRTKAADEDAFLQTVQSQDYQEYRARTGGWFPRWPGKPTPANGLRAVKPDPARPAGRDTK
jgi:protein-S-isoprenylcysteine O-methyltransferase Ste14